MTELSSPLQQGSADSEALPLRLPVPLIYVWTAPGNEALLSRIEPPSLLGLIRLAPRLFGVRPSPGEAAEIDVALDCCGRFLEPIVGSAEHPQAEVSALILPGEVCGFGDRWEVARDPLLDELFEKPPSVPWGRVYLTGYAASRIEGRRPVTPCGDYRRPSGGTVNLFRSAGPTAHLYPWRSPRLLGRETRFVHRPAVEAMLSGLAQHPVLRIVGPLGCGKTRLVWQTLGPGRPEVRSGDKATGWVNLAALRIGTTRPEVLLLRHLEGIAARARQPFDLGASLPESETGTQLRRLTTGEHLPPDLDLVPLVVSALKVLSRKTSPPFRLIFDSLEAARPADRDLVGRLIEAFADSADVRFVLVARTGHPWPQAWSASPLVNLPPASEGQMAEITASLFEGLSMPGEVERRFLTECQGCVFALEEGLVKMIHQRQLRRIYGNFFFGGSKETEYEPSARFVQHVEAEAWALGAATGPRLLSFAGGGAPPNLIRTAATELGLELEEAWESPFLAAGWLERCKTPWGHGVTFAIPALARALGTTVEGPAAVRVRHALGCALAAASADPPALWQAYPLLSGSAEALPVILSLAKGSAVEVAPAGILEGLARELVALRRRGGGDSLELALLWKILPLARRLGRLERYAEELPRAIELAKAEPRKVLALATLKAEVDLIKGRLEEGERTLRAALELVMDQDPGRQALVLLQLGRLMIRQERYVEARALFEQLLPVLEEGASPAQVASCLFHLGNIALHQDRLDDAYELHQRALTIRERDDNLKAAGSSYSALGATALADGDYARALEEYARAEELLEQHGDPGEISYALLGRGRALNRIGDYAAAGEPLRRALAIREQQPDPVGEAIARLWLAMNLLDQGRTDEALKEARQAHFALSLGSEGVQLADAEQTLGRIHLRRRAFDKARSHFNAALSLQRRHHQASSVLVTESLQLERALEQGETPEVRRICKLFTSERHHLRPMARRELVHYR
ncbi:MAG: tetratricopeptide repeat protein, partial [Acidobacteria bacterium]|nr:tetratricopeptide repeat protein [Acidobacteriota bacterium]